MVFKKIIKNIKEVIEISKRFKKESVNYIMIIRRFHLKIIMMAFCFQVRSVIIIILFLITKGISNKWDALTLRDKIQLFDLWLFGFILLDILIVGSK